MMSNPAASGYGAMMFLFHTGRTGGAVPEPHRWALWHGHNRLTSREQQSGCFMCCSTTGGACPLHWPGRRWSKPVNRASFDKPPRPFAMIAHRLFLFTCVLATWLASPTPGCGAAQDPSLPVEMPLNTEAIHGGNLYFTLYLEDGEELLLGVDTGMPQTVLDISLEPKLGKCLGTKTIRYAWAGKSTAREYAAPRLYLGRSQLQIGSRIFTDNLRARGLTGPRAAGILGMDCLRHYCLQLDYGAMRMRFLDPNHPGGANLGKPYRVHMFCNLPFVRADLAGAGNLWFRIDSGIPTSMPDFVLRQKPFQRQRNKQTPALSSELTPVSIALFSEASFGGVAYTNVTLAQDRRVSWWDGNFLGLGFLSRNLATLNFPKRLMYLRPTGVQDFPKGCWITASAIDFFDGLQKKRQLPGWSKGDTGHATAAADFVFDGKYPVTRTFDVRKNANASCFHYRVVHPSPDGGWRLQRAWRTDPSGSVVEEYLVPSPP
jgi:hypothetical protein